MAVATPFLPAGHRHPGLRGHEPSTGSVNRSLKAISHPEQDTRSWESQEISCPEYSRRNLYRRQPNSWREMHSSSQMGSIWRRMKGHRFKPIVGSSETATKFRSQITMALPQRRLDGQPPGTELERSQLAVRPSLTHMLGPPHSVRDQNSVLMYRALEHAGRTATVHSTASTSLLRDAQAALFGHQYRRPLRHRCKCVGDTSLRSATPSGWTGAVRCVSNPG